MSTVTVSKVSAKSAVAKATRAKPVAKPATKKATAPRAKKAAPAAPVLTHTIQDYARPKAGTRLFAFTDAWLELTGIKAGSAVSRATLVKIAGEVAITYHTRNGNFEKTENGLSLSAKGASFFAARDAGNDAQLIAAFKEAMTTGQAPEVLAIKDPKAIIKVAA